ALCPHFKKVPKTTKERTQRNASDPNKGCYHLHFHISSLTANALLRCEQRNTEAAANHLNH
ncbi:hypothetical protein, partial [Vibrio vulnificus]|uniref:hypothetical protein n=1 Tax=Vibrio vulnificus TaxID=672 RepID=UPI0030FE7DD4